MFLVYLGKHGFSDFDSEPRPSSETTCLTATASPEPVVFATVKT